MVAGGAVDIRRKAAQRMRPGPNVPNLKDFQIAVNDVSICI
jgi:hypothetical protein